MSRKNSSLEADRCKIRHDLPPAPAGHWHGASHAPHAAGSADSIHPFTRFSHSRGVRDYSQETPRKQSQGSPNTRQCLKSEKGAVALSLFLFLPPTLAMRTPGKSGGVFQPTARAITTPFAAGTFGTPAPAEGRAASVRWEDKDGAGGAALPVLIPNSFRIFTPTNVSTALGEACHCCSTGAAVAAAAVPETTQDITT